MRSVPCWDGIRIVGIGTSKPIGGIARGITPKTAYFARIVITRRLAGMAGKGNPSNVCRSMTLVRSSPVIVKVDSPGCSPEVIS